MPRAGYSPRAFSLSLRVKRDKHSELNHGYLTSQPVPLSKFETALQHRSVKVEGRLELLDRANARKKMSRTIR